MAKEKQAIAVRRVAFNAAMKKGETKTMYRAAVKSIGVVKESKLVDNLVKENYVPEIYASGVLNKIGKTMFDYMVLGHSVQIPGLGTLCLKVTSEASETEKGCTAKSVKGVKIVLLPNEEIRDELTKLTFSMEGATVSGGADDDEGEVGTGNSGADNGNSGNDNAGSGSGTGIPITPGPGGDDMDL